MSDDKLLDLTPITISFEDGERPTSSKLEGMMDQEATATEFLENLIGDAFGNSLQLNNVWINNFSRDIGDRDKISPIIMPGETISNYSQNLTLGENEHELDLIPTGVGAAIISSSSDTSVVPGQFKTTIAGLEVPGDWTIAGGLVEGGID